MGISRDSLHKRRSTGGRKKHWRKGKKYEMGRVPANTKLSAATAVRPLRVRGGAHKFRTLRADHGNYAWGSEACTRKTRIIDVTYNASNNELVRTKTLVKSAIIQIDATPFKQWYQAHYGVALGEKVKTTEAGKAVEAAKAAAAEAIPEADKKTSGHVQRKLKARMATRKIDPLMVEQFQTGRLYAAISSRPGQCGRVDGYILEGKELEFYVKKMQKKTKKVAE